MPHHKSAPPLRIERLFSVAAMVTAVATQVKASGKRPPKPTGVGRQVQAHYGGLSYDECIHVTPDEWDRMAQEVQSFGAFVPPPGFKAPGAAKPFGGATVPGMRRCPRCPLLASGSPTMHAIGQKCEVAAKCVVCFSVQHMDHACFIKTGVPKYVKMAADMSTEITRLHALYTAGK